MSGLTFKMCDTCGVEAEGEAHILKIWNEARERSDRHVGPGIEEVLQIDGALSSVITWMKNILDQCRSNAETCDACFLVFFEFITSPSILQPPLNYELSTLLLDVQHLSKLAACCIVLASKLHETKRKVQLASFTFTRCEELFSLEIEILQNVDIRALGTSPTALGRCFADAWVGPNHGLGGMIGWWSRELLGHSCSLLAGAHVLALAALFLSATPCIDLSEIIEHMPESIRSELMDGPDCFWPAPTSARQVSALGVEPVSDSGRFSCSELPKLLNYFGKRAGDQAVKARVRMCLSQLFIARSMHVTSGRDVNPLMISSSAPEEGHQELESPQEPTPKRVRVETPSPVSVISPSGGARTVVQAAGSRGCGEEEG